MIVYGVCRSCTNCIPIASVREIPKTPQTSSNDITKVGCKRCGVSNLFQSKDLKIKRTLPTSKVVYVLIILGLLWFVVLYVSPLSVLGKFLLITLYLLASAIGIYKMYKINRAVQNFNRK